MPTYICQGRYTREAIQGMIKSPEDRTEAVSKFAQSVGGQALVVLRDLRRDGLPVIVEGPNEQAMAATVLAAAAGGGVTDLRTTVAMTAAEAKEAFKKAGEIGGSFRAAGQAR